ncbi:response regulator (plasmid) [Vibrio sp. SS-MA-C1-2]|nr:response regulator [Vibrio sp. SS-MA-C1-2]
MFKILIMDNHPMVANHIKQSFEAQGCETITSNSYDKVSDTLLESMDYLITDLQLDSDIFNTLQHITKIKESHPSLKISIFSGSTDIKHLPAIAHIIGIDHILDKRYVEDISDIILNHKSSLPEVSKSALTQGHAFIDIQSKEQNVKLLKGLSNEPSKIVALDNHISPAGISKFKSRIQEKIGNLKDLTPWFRTYN